MGLFDFLSGSDDAERAAAANRAAAQDAFNRSGNLAGVYQTGALGQLGEGLTRATGALDTGLTGQLGAYNPAIASATGAGQAGVAAYAPLSALGSKYGEATTRLLSALGVGPNQFDINQFRNTPGYQFQQSEAARAAGNAASKLGIVGSGNTLQAISDRAGNIADTTFNQNYLQPLSQFITPELQATAGAASGIAGANQNLAGTYLAGGGLLGGAYGTNAAAKAGLYTGAGESGANVLGNVYGGQTQANQNLATGNIQANNLVAQAGMQDASNFWNLLGNIGKGATGAFFGSGTKAA